MTASSGFEAVVVGNGAIGGAIALELCKRGHRVARVGRAARPLAASRAAGAMLGTFGEVTRNTLRSKYGRIKLESDIKASSMWPEWDRALSELSGCQDSLYAARGTVIMLNTIGTAAVDTENYRAIEAALTEYEHSYEHVDPAGLEWYTPDPLSRSLSAIYLPGEHAVDASRLLDRLDAAFTNSGGSVVDADAATVTVEAGRCTGVRLHDGTLIEADTVVVAAGAKSLELLDSLPEVRRRIPPLFSGYGVSALVRTADHGLPTHVLRTPNRAFACGLHCVPRGDGQLYLGGTNVINEQPRAHATMRDLLFLMECSINQLHTALPMAGVEAVQVGNRPVPADGFPLLGRVGPDGLFLATGTYRDGLHQSPLIADYIADLIESTATGYSALLADFVPERAPLSSADRNEVVARATDELLAAGFETDWNLKPEWPELIQQHAQQQYAHRAEQLHPAFTPPPELLAKLTPSIAQKLVDYYQAWS